MKTNWISVKDRPLIIQSKLGWECTDDGAQEFIAAIPYTDTDLPEQTLWWIHHCTIEDESGLCVVGDGFNEPAGWQIQDVQFWAPWVSSPESTLLADRLQAEKGSKDGN